MHVIVLVVIRVVRIQRRRIKFHLSFGFKSVKQRFLDAKGLRRLARLLRIFRPVVRVTPYRDNQLPRRHYLLDLAEVFHVPILGSNRAWRRGLPVLVVVHQHDGVALFGEESVIIGIVPRRESKHQLQPYRVQRRP